MTKRVFFSFHYDDVKSFRANVVRKHGLVKETGSAGFFDASIWEDAELHGDLAVKGLINRNLTNTSVTCVLIGSQTWSRRWVKYEIFKSYDRGNTLMGIHINGIKGKDQLTLAKGLNPFDYLGFFIDAEGKCSNYQELLGGKWVIYKDLNPTQKTFNRKFWNKGYTLSEWVPTYDWVADSGYLNFPTWVEGT